MLALSVSLESQNEKNQSDIWDFSYEWTDTKSNVGLGPEAKLEE